MPRSIHIYPNNIHTSIIGGVMVALLMIPASQSIVSSLALKLFTVDHVWARAVVTGTLFALAMLAVKEAVFPEHSGF